MSNFPNYWVLENSIHLKSGLEINTTKIAQAVQNTNAKFVDLKNKTEAMTINVFEALDFRMLSGLVGETLVGSLSNSISGLQRNPNIDGYPDLTDVSRPKFREDFSSWSKSDIRQFIKYPHGGIEVKNTFGTKKNKADLMPGQQRILKINSKPDWKAHHRYTNCLLATFSDYIDGCPQIVAAMYSDKLTEEDWKEKQDPKEGSTMTSFSVIERTGWLKLREGLLLCMNNSMYMNFFRG